MGCPNLTYRENPTPLKVVYNAVKTNKKGCAGLYRFNFNGQERDDEIYGEGNAYDFGARIQDPRLGRFLSVDPLIKNFPSRSPYSFAGCNPIYLIDVAGKFEYPADKAAAYRKSYPMLTKYLETQVKQDVMKSEALITGFATATHGNMTRDKVEEMATWGSGPTIKFVKDPGFVMGTAPHGYYDPYFNEIQLNEADAKRIEAILQSDASEEEKMAAFLPWYKTLMHEGAHSGNYTQKPGYDPEKVNKDEVGYVLEEETWGKTGKYTPRVDDLHIDTEKTKEVINELEKTEEGKTLLPTLPAK